MEVRIRGPVGLIVLLLSVWLTVGCSSGMSAASLPWVTPFATVASSSLPEPAATRVPGSTATPTPKANPTSPATSTVSPTNTRSVPDGRSVAVVVENELPARPQVGLAAADAIYEAIAEFNLTRFVAIYSDSSPDAVGPIRSGRDYHAAIAAEYEAALAHCTDVPSLPKVVAATEVVNLDGCRVASPVGFWRNWSKLAPHNLFVTIPELRGVAGGAGTYGPLAQRRAWPTPPKLIGHISFVYPDDHPVVWRYDANRREYLRWQDGAPHFDASGDQVAASAVVIQFVPVRPTSYFGEAGYHLLELTGKGDAVIYAAGARLEAIWRRTDLTTSTRFYDPAGDQLLLPPGRIFFQIVGIGTPVEDEEQ